MTTSIAGESEPPVLEFRSVAAGYGPFRALFDVSFTVARGEAVALLGPNGAGKTTVARVASGLVKPTDGAVLIGGVDRTGAAPHEITNVGVRHAPEGRSVFATLTVEENLSLSFRRCLGRRKVSAGLDEAYGMFPVLGERRRQLAGTMSGGEQRMLALSRVMVERPPLLIADELSLGLAPVIIQAVYEALATLRSSGTAILVVEQHVGHALELADRAVVLDHGRVDWEGVAADAGGHVAGGFTAA